MKSYIILCLTFCLFTVKLISQVKENRSYIADNGAETIDFELGIAVGNPSALNLTYVHHFSDFLTKLSGNYLGSLRGVQFDIGYKLYSDDLTYFALTVGAGSTRYPKNNNIFRTDSLGAEWDYGTINAFFNSQGFFVSLGVSSGQGTLQSPRANIQVGYLYQFK